MRSWSRGWRAINNPKVQRALYDVARDGRTYRLPTACDEARLGLVALRDIPLKGYAVTVEAASGLGEWLPPIGLSWTYSDWLGGPFAYVPPTIQGAVAWFPLLRAESPLAAVRIKLFRYSSSSALRVTPFSESLVHRQETLVDSEAYEVITHIHPQSIVGEQP